MAHKKKKGRTRGREVIHLSLHCHRENDSRIKMSSNESHFNVCFINCAGRSHETSVHKPPFSREERAEALLLTARPNRLTGGRLVSKHGV